MSTILTIMLVVSIFMGLIGLFGLLWGLKTRQFEDYSKFLDGTKFDSEDALNDAYKMEQKKKEALKKREDKNSGYRPPD
ncbi:cbb3-type cytochrome oxidase assembly protein CcoS [Campylobacter geochelonis]|uniref:Type cbb3 cytochrome oxidase biogenesis protein CcoS, involved in heme b insertion n=1 Tax=Campylobacter geochelonis TaxID=1780362 RepID=A0A128EHU5_9BACT|nr:cbb3-type cytochrome oxidase assembly protein CcoS [Campylobacter geochelonis]QKF71906.1 cytochrome oxidase maturation protein, cbb3-type [Campylobacter geochelonis]CZE47898.1 Type cbb3 cytochrome oxidase biogenesis protein CcoS%2C involved in heme b insertion [Campylobacter geochelonis]